MTMASDLFPKIEEFLRLSALLDLTLGEELTLMSLHEAEWQAWRTRSVPSHTIVPPLLVRRLDYALALLRRMVAASPTDTAYSRPEEHHS